MASRQLLYVSPHCESPLLGRIWFHPKDGDGLLFRLYLLVSLLVWIILDFAQNRVNILSHSINLFSLFCGDAK